MLIAKPGLDGHDRGAKFVARALKEEGVEVIYTGLHQTPEMIVNAAVQEDVDAIGLSILSGGQVSLINRIVQLLKEKKADNILLIVGGIVPKSDREILKAMGVSKFFGPGTSSSEIVQFTKDFF
jgi:methylmalonyl-CoA mutase C-terminal domain/subunit